MNINNEELLARLTKLLKQKRSRLWYAERLGVSEDKIDKLLNEIKGVGEEAELLIQDIDNVKGKEIRTINSHKPLSPEEITKLAQVDELTSFVARTWLKSHKNNTWTYSIDVRYRTTDFYTKNEIAEKLKEIFPKVNSIKIPKLKRVKDESALFIYLADDHAGTVIENSIYDLEKGKTYEAKLDIIYWSILQLGKTFDKVVIFSLGDQLNGWNSLTTRGGHEVKSLSNKDQFDIYVKGRKDFYDKLFSSGISDNYSIFNMENSNHSGLGFSYMADKALELYVETKYPEVEFYNTSKMIDEFKWGVHVFALTHGKDEKFQKTPFPLNLNDRSDVYFYQYFDRKGYSSRNYELHVIKGDLHQYNMNFGKSCRYVNLPSILGSNNYSESNFGYVRAGAVIEIVNKNKREVISQPVWLE